MRTTPSSDLVAQTFLSFVVFHDLSFSLSRPSVYLCVFYSLTLSFSLNFLGMPFSLNLYLSHSLSTFIYPTLSTFIYPSLYGSNREALFDKIFIHHYVQSNIILYPLEFQANLRIVLGPNPPQTDILSLGPLPCFSMEKIWTMVRNTLCPAAHISGS